MVRPHDDAAVRGAEPTIKPGGLTFSDFLNVFLFNTKHDVGAVIKALSSKGMFESLAEPNLIASSGKEASFLAGGEYPYPIVQPGSNGNSITIQFKEFGVRLSFTPTVLAGDLIDLKVRPEVSSLDFTNAIILEGFRVPAISTRRTDTEVELQDGQTFAIAGLLNNSVNNTMQKIPGIGDLPVLGYLFKSRAYQKDQTELVVMITPQILRRGSTGASEGLPSLLEPFMAPPPKNYPVPPPYTGSPRFPANQPPKKSGGDNTPAPQPQQMQQPQAQQPGPSKVDGSAQMPAAQTPLVSERAAPPSAAAPAPSKVEAPASNKLEAPASNAKPDPKALKKQQDADRKAAADQAVADKEAARLKAIEDKKAAVEKAEADKKQAEENARQQKLLADRGRRNRKSRRRTPSSRRSARKTRKNSRRRSPTRRPA